MDEKKQDDPGEEAMGELEAKRLVQKPPLRVTLKTEYPDGEETAWTSPILFRQVPGHSPVIMGGFQGRPMIIVATLEAIAKARQFIEEILGELSFIESLHEKPSGVMTIEGPLPPVPRGPHGPRSSS